MKIRIKVRLADGTYEYRWVDVGKSPGGGSGLPAITDADEGKFLRIVDGKPTWKDAPSSGSMTAEIVGSGFVITAPGHVAVIENGGFIIR